MKYKATYKLNIDGRITKYQSFRNFTTEKKAQESINKAKRVFSSNFISGKVVKLKDFV
jgi:hypothetical protein